MTIRTMTTFINVALHFIVFSGVGLAMGYPTQNVLVSAGLIALVAGVSHWRAYAMGWNVCIQRAIEVINGIAGKDCAKIED